MTHYNIATHVPEQLPTSPIQMLMDSRSLTGMIIYHEDHNNTCLHAYVKHINSDIHYCYIITTIPF